MYTFRIYYNVNGGKRRRRKMLYVPGYYDLADAWSEALRSGTAHTKEDELLSSIRFIGKDKEDEK